MIVKTNIEEYGFRKDFVFGNSTIKIEVNSRGHIVCWTSDTTWYAIADMTDYTIYEDVNVPDVNKMWLYVDGEFIDITPKPDEEEEPLP